MRIYLAATEPHLLPPSEGELDLLLSFYDITITSNPSRKITWEWVKEEKG